jgi:hypothetical protein
MRIALNDDVARKASTSNSDPPTRSTHIVVTPPYVIAFSDRAQPVPLESGRIPTRYPSCPAAGRLAPKVVRRELAERQAPAEHLADDRHLPRGTQGRRARENVVRPSDHVARAKSEALTSGACRRGPLDASGSFAE